VYDLYGPSEDTTYSTAALRHQGGSATIGKPLDNTQIYILDPHLQPVPIGVAGELHIAGQGLARGYLHRPALTAERFIPNPFASHPPAGSHTDAQAGRVYKTGDVVRWLPDGNIAFLGRLDHQVKVRGFRIELGEIDTVLRQHPEVRDAVVVAQTHADGQPRLVAYLSTTRAVPISVLQTYLKHKLPDYMLPSAWVVLDRFPYTPNGKIDRQALPEPDRVGTVTATEFVPPQTPTQKRLASIWAELLGLESRGGPELRMGFAHRVGLHDNFFALGGHSLLAIRLLAEIETQFGYKLPVASLFQSPSLAALAMLLTHHDPQPSASTVIPMQAAGAQPPFFCLPGDGGYTFYLRDLARALGPHRPFWALQPPGFEPGLPALHSMQECTDFFLSAVLATQPTGPAYLGGHSAGGLIAFALALALQQRGYPVPAVLIFDARPPRLATAPTQDLFPAIDEQQAFRNVLPVLEEVLGLEGTGHREKLTVLAGEERWAYVANLFKAHTRLSSQVGVEQCKRLVAVHQGLVEAVQGYTPERKYHGQLMLFRATDPPPEAPDWYVTGWQAVCDQPIQMYTVRGTHDSLLEPPQVALLAQQVQACLAPLDALVDSRTVEAEDHDDTRD
jgi:thioesterase domain-containing protein